MVTPPAPPHARPLLHRIWPVAAVVTAVILIFWLAPWGESKRERAIRGTEAAMLGVAIIISGVPVPGTRSHPPLRHDLARGRDRPDAVCTIEPRVSDEKLEQALGDVRLRRLRKTQRLDSDVPAFALFYDDAIVVIHSTDLSNGLRFKVSRTVCSTGTPALLVRGPWIDVETPQ